MNFDEYFSMNKKTWKSKNLLAKESKNLLFESSNSVGGRVRTDTVDIFRLDKVFQIFITAYSKTKKSKNWFEGERKKGILLWSSRVF